MSAIIKNTPAKSESNNNERKLWIGSVNAKVLHYNPTLEELESSPGKYYFKKDVEPVYESEKGYSHVFYLEAQDPRTEELVYERLRLFVSAEPNISNRTPKAEFIDIEGRTTWLEITAKGKPIKGTQQYFDFETAIPSHRGFKELTDLLSILSGFSKANGQIRKKNEEIEKFNVEVELRKEGELKELLPYHRLEIDYTKLGKGDNSYIKALMSDIIEAENQVHVAFGVRDGNFQDVYAGRFANPANLTYYPTEASLNAAKGIVESIKKDKEYADSVDRDFSYYPVNNMVFRVFDKDSVGTSNKEVGSAIPNLGANMVLPPMS